MIKLIFSKQKEVFRIEIKDREVWYVDRKTKVVRLIPKDENINKLILMSRNKIPPQVIQFFSLTKLEEEQYNNAKDENELAELCINDARKNGAKLEKKEII